MKVALVHDYLDAYGGAERVLEVLAEMYPEAPIYTAFYNHNSPAYEKFKNRDIRPSFAQRIPGFVNTLHSPLRFMSPWIWESFDLDEYDVVISSASWYITKGVITRPETLHVSYIHTPPRYLYGYATALDWQRHALIRMYATVVNKGLREYDFLAAQRPNVLISNSKNVQERIRKFYRRESEVIYPPVEISRLSGDSHVTRSARDDTHDMKSLSSVSSVGKYYLTGGRLVGAKHFDVIVQAAVEAGVQLKVFGEGKLRQELESMGQGIVEFVGEVKEEELGDLYAGATAFIAMADDEDFGITPVEAMMVGTPVIAYRGGGYVETVVEGETGEFVDELSVEEVKNAIQKFEVKSTKFEKEVIQIHAQKFSKQRFVKEMRELVDKEYLKLRGNA